MQLINQICNQLWLIMQYIKTNQNMIAWGIPAPH